MKKILCLTILLILSCKIFSKDRMCNSKIFKDTVIENKNIPKNKRLYYNYSFQSGIWIPTGYLNMIGSHFLCGFNGCLSYNKFLFGLYLNTTLGKSKKTIEYFSKDTILQTNNINYCSTGIELGYALFDIDKYFFNLKTGYSWDFIAISNNKNKYAKDYIYSVNYNAGVEIQMYKRIIGNLNCTGLNVKYNYLKFLNSKGTNISGNYYLISIMLGYSSNNYKNKYLSEINENE